MHLVHCLDNSDDDAFTDATDPTDPKRQVMYEAIPERVRTRGVVRMLKKKTVPPGADDQPNRSRPLPPVPGSDLEELLDTEVETQKLKLQQTQGQLLRHSWWRSGSHVPSSNRVTKK